ncbi:hypothetical protein [Budvicia aquatica]|uniref:Uncharacterized protein n=1 Tax=Budvicia aquatica TaxID=82979 RepID=A0A2C6DJ60_9GAMM|nr:hypothetical protein [Budvicia aquatica]PHI31266.1 hypothetical protein CRN84_18935 [Budvicia aquatica]PHI31761.1 hypothetical protein CRN84_21740 [Budvicia aquatica]VFS51553.1 Uncharacterised protein [Budvicia aquatica]VFS52667.1 Uncharacterised protein [Budvicia aquatica]
MPLLLSKYLGIAFLLGLTIVLFNVFSSTGEVTGFWHGISLLFWLTVGPGIGLILGALARQWLMPDAVYTHDGVLGLFKAKLFWAIGPQSMGWLLGLFAISEQLN